MAAETAVTRFGRLAVRIAAVAMFALVVLGMSARSAGAETFPGNVSVSQNEYVKICRDLGGKTSSVGTRQVKCDMGGGYSSVCNFKTMKCTDTIPFTQPQAGEPVLGGAVVLDGASATVDEQPSAGTTRVTANRATIVLAEDEPSR
jgi:hypothetical protein